MLHCCSWYSTTLWLCFAAWLPRIACGYLRSTTLWLCFAAWLPRIACVVTHVKPRWGCALLLGYHALHTWLLMFNPIGVLLRWLGYHALHAWLLTFNHFVVVWLGYCALHAWLLMFNPVGVVLRWFVTTHCIRGLIGRCPMVGYIWLSALVWWLLMVGYFFAGR